MRVGTNKNLPYGSRTGGPPPAHGTILEHVINSRITRLIGSIINKCGTEINSRISPFHLRPFSRCGPKVHLRDAIDDVEEVSLETCTTDESSINIGLSQQILGVGTLHGSSILDPDSRGNLRGDIFGNPGTNIFVSFLRHLWSSSKPGSNGPN